MEVITIIVSSKELLLGRASAIVREWAARANRGIGNLAYAG